MSGGSSGSGGGSGPSASSMFFSGGVGISALNSGNDQVFGPIGVGGLAPPGISSGGGTRDGSGIGTAPGTGMHRVRDLYDDGGDIVDAIPVGPAALADDSLWDTSYVRNPGASGRTPGRATGGTGADGGAGSGSNVSPVNTGSFFSAFGGTSLFSLPPCKWL